MLKIIIVCFFATFLLGFSTPIKQNKQIKKIFVIKNQKSEYKIVLPVIANKALARHLHNAAKEFSQIIADSYGVNLPVVTEEKLPKNSLGIYIGNTKTVVAYFDSLGACTGNYGNMETGFYSKLQGITVFYINGAHWFPIGIH